MTELTISSSCSKGGGNSCRRMTESTTSSSSCKGMSFGGNVQVMRQVTRPTIMTYGTCEMTNTVKPSSRWGL